MITMKNQALGLGPKTAQAPSLLSQGSREPTRPEALGAALGNLVLSENEEQPSAPKNHEKTNHRPKQLIAKKIAAQRQLAAALQRQQVADRGRRADGLGLVVKNSVGGSDTAQNEQILIRVNGEVQTYTPDDFSDLTARPGNRVQYTNELLFNVPAPLMGASADSATGLQVPPGFRPPVYLEFVDDQVGWGVFARQAIKKGELIGEYTGVVTKMGLGNAYTMFYAPEFPELIIDATHFGNEMRFINHDSDPNCWFYFSHCEEGLPHRIFVATRDIEVGEQILTNYGEQYWGDQQPKKLS